MTGTIKNVNKHYQHMASHTLNQFAVQLTSVLTYATEHRDDPDMQKLLALIRSLVEKYRDEDTACRCAARPYPHYKTDDCLIKTA